MRLLALLVAALPLCSQAVKPPAPAVAWSYETPHGFHLLEPAYRFPTQIKQALVQFVQPVPARARAYQSVYLDKHRFSAWLKGVLMEVGTQRAQQIKSAGHVLSSDPSKMSSDGGTILSTATRPPRRAAEPDAIESYLEALKLWDPE